MFQLFAIDTKASLEAANIAADSATQLEESLGFDLLREAVMTLSVITISWALWVHARPFLMSSAKDKPKKKQRSPVHANAGAASPTKAGSGAQDTRPKQQGARLAACASKAMLQYLDERQFTTALNLFRTCERDGRDWHFSDELLISFIQSAVRVSKLDVVEKMLRKMKRNNSTPSVEFWQMTLRLLSSRQHFGACLDAIAIFDNDIPEDRIVFSCMVNAALHAGMPDRAAAMIQAKGDMIEVEPNDYIHFFRTFVAVGDVQAAESLYKKLSAEVVTTHMLNLLLLTCVKVSEPERAMAHIRAAHELEKVASKTIVDVVSYNTAINGFTQMPTRESRARCIDCLREMVSVGIEPDDISCNSLLDLCLAHNDASAAHEIYDVLMRRRGSWNTTMCTSMVRSLVQVSCVPKAFEFYREMQKRGAKGHDISAYSVLIRGLVAQNDIDRALEIVRDMEANGFAPDDIILTHLIDGCRNVCNPVLGRRLFEEITGSGVKPSKFTCTAMLKLLGRCDEAAEACDVLATWQAKYGFRPSVLHYTCVVSGALRWNSPDLAWKAYGLMVDNSVFPDEVCFATLLNGMVMARYWEHVVSLVKQSVQFAMSLRPHLETLNSALMNMEATGDSAQAEQLRLLMASHNTAASGRNASTINSGNGYYSLSRGNLPIESGNVSAIK